MKIDSIRYTHYKHTHFQGNKVNTIVEKLSMRDFYAKVNPNKQAMIALIKGGAFDTFASRYRIMVDFIWLTCDKKKRLTLQNMPGLIRYNLLPDNSEEYITIKINKDYINNKQVVNIVSKALMKYFW